MFNLDYFLFAILIAIFAFVYTNILIDTGEILEWWSSFWYNVFDNEGRLSKGDGYHPLYKGFIQCEKCVAGQLALWSFLILNFDIYLYASWSFLLILQHALFITLSIFLSTIVKLIYSKLNGH
jgi:hypothetical protein